MFINIGDVVRETRAEGPGNRYALWVQGCRIRCPGCCNPHFFSQQPKTIRSVEEVFDEIRALPSIEGVTFLGGEPFEQAAALTQLAQKVRSIGLSVMVFSGRTWKELQREPLSQKLLQHCDLLVAGPFDQNQKEVDQRRWIGSYNQTTHILSERYQHWKDNWPQGRNCIEMVYKDGELSINGFPVEELSRTSIRAWRK
ncbi:MAG: 4Fe-4S single cluster domain-containing protein [Myxococcota bacterium]|nr:4Fe-4S single cluster domain-containing protein [Myxococcota bacterium]